MKLTIDVENTAQKTENGKLMLDPFTPDNQLVLVCTKQDDGIESSFWFNHATHSTENAKQLLQDQLDKASVLICHNAQHELVWLWDTGFKYDGPVFDTMLVEYLCQRGQKEPLSLDALAQKWNLANQKLDTLQDQLKQGVTVDEIDGDELQTYCLADVKATHELAMGLERKLATPSFIPLQKIVDLTNTLCVLLAKIYYRGFTVDTNALMAVKEEFQKEQQTLNLSLDRQVQELMGDTPINLASPEQLSSLIYSRKPTDKATWASSFTPHMKRLDFAKGVKEHSTIVYKTKAIQCPDCRGKGFNLAIKKDGSVGKAKRICKTCERIGIVYLPQKEVAGLKFSPPASSWVANHGFATNKGSLEKLEATARINSLTFAQEFLHNIRRLSALDTYLSSFVDGIKTFTKEDKKLHVRLAQHRTTTGRLASDSPNLQNMPRAKTFPIKKVFRSRWPEGKIVDADFAQLEFRAAAFLANDKIAKHEINTGFDVHSYTAQVISNAGQPMGRQEAKAHTFAPLFGATGYGRTKSEAAYYKQFVKKYEGIARWHKKLANEVMATGMVTTPTGRQFAFPDAERRSYGGVTHFTSIKNYPVQSLSTDIVQLTLILVEDNMRKKNLQSVIVNSVHDSVVIDMYPTEEAEVMKTIGETQRGIRPAFLERFGVDFDVPLELDSKVGPNWMDVA